VNGPAKSFRFKVRKRSSSGVHKVKIIDQKPAKLALEPGEMQGMWREVQSKLPLM